MRCLILYVLSFLVLGAVQADRDWTKISTQDIQVLSTSEQRLITATFKSQSDGQNHNRIVGGNDALPHSFPYQVALFIKMPNQEEKIFCGGSLLDDVFVLTAAHCLKWNFMATEIEVILGAHNVQEDEPTQKRYISKVYYIHKGWSPFTLKDDIAIVRLPEKVEFTDEIQPILLPKSSDQWKSFAFQTATVSGWGKTSDKAPAINPTLKYMKSKVTLPLICKLLFFGRPGATQFCIDGFHEGSKKSTCSGDSGGPVVLQDDEERPVLHGVVSFGIGFGCERGWPQVNTKVSRYLKWIYEHTGIAIRK